MKTNGNRSVMIMLLITLLNFSFSTNTIAQPDYDFRNPSLISGTNRQPGAKYIFPNVKPGVDAFVTINSIVGPVVLNDLDGGSGFAEAFQPVLQVPANSSGYIEFLIEFVEAGTSTPMLQDEVPATPIDVDGQHYASGNVYEFDQLTMVPGSYVDYNMLGGELNIAYTAGWVTGRNVAAIDYPGVDTVAKAAMFTTVNPGISSFIFRTGAENNSNASVQRLRSLYFKKFQYLNSFLSQSPLLFFRGTEKSSAIELQWNLNSTNQLVRVVVEKATQANQFAAIGEVWLTKGNQTEFHFNDASTASANRFYRLKLIAANGSVSYSTVLSFREKVAGSSTAFKVYPTSIQQSATVNVQADKAGTASFQLVDLSGRVIMQKNISVSAGNNNIQVSDLNTLNTGNYVAVLRLDNKTYNQKLIKQ